MIMECKYDLECVKYHIRLDDLIAIIYINT
jgi:hypothetical protein